MRAIAQERSLRFASLGIFVTSLVIVAACTPAAVNMLGNRGGFRLLIIGWSGALLYHFSRSNDFVDSHRTLLVAIACIINTLLFLIPAAIIFVALRRLPVFRIVFQIIWIAFYLGSLFYLFPFTEGF
jgi:hypothetical protein